jgi:hypothetical protein
MQVVGERETRAASFTGLPELDTSEREIFQISLKMLRNWTSLYPESSRTERNRRQNEVHHWENDFCYTRLRFTKCGLSKLQETYLLRKVTYNIIIK